MIELIQQELEHDFLQAAKALVEIQQRLFDRAKITLGMSAYDFWIRRVGEPEVRKRLDNDITDSEWRYQFHGLELDAVHLHDDRFARLELGPRGMTNVFSGWSIGVFVVSTRPPWPTFTRLRNHLYHSPRHPHFQRLSQLKDALIEQGLFVFADPELFDLRNKYTENTENGRIIDIPEGLQPEVSSDVWLCDRYVLADSCTFAQDAV